MDQRKMEAIWIGRCQPCSGATLLPPVDQLLLQVHQGYSKMVASLADFLNKNSPWCWKEKQLLPFDKLKTIISIESILKLSNFELPIVMQTIASTNGMGGVFVQEGHPLAFDI